MEKQTDEGISHHTHGHFIFRSKRSWKEALSTTSSRTKTWRGDVLDGALVASLSAQRLQARRGQPKVEEYRDIHARH